MKVVVIQESILQTDITKEELAERWKKIEALQEIEELKIVDPERYPTTEELDEIIGGADALFGVWIGADLFTTSFFARHPALKYIATLGHGWEPFDVELTRHHVPVHDERIKSIDWSKEANSDEFCRAVTPQIELFGKTIGIVGLGEIGFALAKMAQGFGMRVVAYSTHKKWGEKYGFVQQLNSLEELLEMSDFISLHLPHTPATQHIINAKTIDKMKDGAILINTARGALIDEQALADALAAGKLGAAGLDVLTEEPPLHGSPLLHAPNTTITGHVAWLTKESRLRAVDMAIDNFANYLQGTPKSVIN